MPFPVLGAIGAIGGLASGVGSMAAASGQQQRPRTHQSVRDAMRAYWYLPSAYSYEAAFRPAYTALGARGVQDILMGSPGRYETAYTPEGRPQTVYTGETPGLLPMTGETVAGLTDVYAPLYEASIAATSDPEQVAFLRNLRDTASSELALGGALSPSVRREIMQSSLPGILRRYGPGASAGAMSLMEIGRSAEQRLSDRIRQASGVAGVYQSLAPEYRLQDALLQMTGGMAINPATLLQIAEAQQAGAGMQVVNPYQVWGTGAASPQPPNFSTANALGAMSGGMFNMAGQIGAGWVNSPRSGSGSLSPATAAYNPWSYGGNVAPDLRTPQETLNYQAAQSWFE